MTAVTVHASGFDAPAQMPVSGRLATTFAPVARV
mgnify:CR=1 FL=1